MQNNALIYMSRRVGASVDGRPITEIPTPSTGRWENIVFSRDQSSAAQTCLWRATHRFICTRLKWSNKSANPTLLSGTMVISGCLRFLGFRGSESCYRLFGSQQCLHHIAARRKYIVLVKWSWTLYIIGCQGRVLPPAAVWCFPSVASLSLERPTDLTAAAAARCCSCHTSQTFSQTSFSTLGPFFNLCDKIMTLCTVWQKAIFFVCQVHASLCSAFFMTLSWKKNGKTAWKKREKEINI